MLEHRGYELAYLCIGFVAIAMTILAIGLKNKEEQIKTMKLSFRIIINLFLYLIFYVIILII